MPPSALTKRVQCCLQVSLSACGDLQQGLLAAYGKTVGKSAYDFYHCGDDQYLSSVFLSKTPLPDCGDSRGSTCVDYSQWTNAWTEIRGAA